MHSAVKRRLDAHLARTVNQVRRMRQFDLSRKAECEEALKESLEVLRALTMYRGMLKNVSEQHFAASHAALARVIGSVPALDRPS